MKVGRQALAVQILQRGPTAFDPQQLNLVSAILQLFLHLDRAHLLVTRS